MMSHPPQYDFPKNNKMIAMAIMVALGAILHRLEALLPLPSPSIKLGLVNLITLVALVFLGSILGGTFLGLIFFLSLVGGIAAILIMGML